MNGFAEFAPLNAFLNPDKDSLNSVVLAFFSIDAERKYSTMKWSRIKTIKKNPFLTSIDQKIPINDLTR